MKKILLGWLAFSFISHSLQAQQLQSFSVNMQPGENAYLSIKLNKAFPEEEAALRKQDIDLGLLQVKEDAGSRIEWYNMSGKDNKIPLALKGTATLITVIGFDRQQFDKCKTVQDLKRMTGYLTVNSFTHFAPLAEGLTCNITNPCFIVLLEDGRKALLWAEASGTCNYKVYIKW